MWQQLKHRLQNLVGYHDLVDQLPIESTMAAGKFAVQLRVFRRACGHSELLADVNRMDDGCRPVILLDLTDLQDLCPLLANAMEAAERHIARQRH